ncbi:unnamed protein product [Paramecium pentaurelia]|uniref:Uncharacterized protein n=1 Tax=Paramecium pentaurelia TaxID=43138 RepID=A0A8S1U211_9CILI|nr:unnamed protein product [Paramecium pentaurelia]
MLPTELNQFLPKQLNQIFNLNNMDMDFGYLERLMKVIKNIDPNFEGLWPYIYYSYSNVKARAVRIIKYRNDESKAIHHYVTHPGTRLKFILVGNVGVQYPGIDDIIPQATFSVSLGAFIDSPNRLKPQLEKIGTLNSFVIANSRQKKQILLKAQDSTWICNRWMVQIGTNCTRSLAQLIESYQQIIFNRCRNIV